MQDFNEETKDGNEKQKIREYLDVLSQASMGAQ